MKLKSKPNKASDFRMINYDSIVRTTTKNIYKRGVSYYEKKSNIKSVAYGDIDPHDASLNGHGRCIRFAFADDADDLPYVTDIYDDGAFQCRCSGRRVCVHVVAAALYVRDNLEDILARKPVSLPSLRREVKEMEDRAEAADDLRPRDPAAEFAEWLREEKFDKTSAIRRLKYHIMFRALQLTRVVYEDKPRARIDASKAVLDLYLDYMNTIIIEHADTRQKRLAYLRFLMKEYRRTMGGEVEEVIDSYRKSLADLYKTDPEWRKYITSSLKSRLVDDDDDDDDDDGFGHPIYAEDVLSYTGVLEAAGEDASEIFEKYYDSSARICHEYALYLKRTNNPGKAKSVRTRCRKWFGKRTRDLHDCY